MKQSPSLTFNIEKLDGNSIQDLQYNMDADVKNIFSFHTEGNVDIKLTHDEETLRFRLCSALIMHLLQWQPTGILRDWLVQM